METDKKLRVKELRKMEEALHDAAKAVGKMADVMENENSTEQEYEEAMKEFVWRMMMLESLK